MTSGDTTAKTPKTSVQFEVGPGEARRFSSFADLLEWHVTRGEVASWEDALNRHSHVIHDIIFEWYRQGQIGCQFAVHLAQEPAASKWPSELVEPGFDVSSLNARVDALGRVSEALQLVFPNVSTAEDTAELVAKLCLDSDRRWSCYEGAWDYSEEDAGSASCVPIALRWNPLGRKYTSLVLGIAPFETMPFTRRLVGAPFTVLVLRATEPGRKKPWRDPMLDRSGSHLAHMDDRCGSNRQLKRLLERGTEFEVASLARQDFDSVARAQTTFAFPISCRAHLKPVLLGTAPKKLKGKGRKGRVRRKRGPS